MQLKNKLLNRKSQMKFCFLTTGDIKTIATSKRALGMSNFLAKLGWDVSLIMLNTEENKIRVDRECNKGVKILFYNKSNPLSEIIQKHKLIKNIKPNILYVNALGLRNMISPFLKCKVLIEHSELASGIPDNKGVKKWMAKFFETASIYLSDGLICASKFLMDYFDKKVSNSFKKKLPLHYNPYAFNMQNDWPKVLEDTHKLKKQFEGKKVFMYLGTITRNYGLFTMIQAFESIMPNYPNALLLLAGRGRHLEEAKQYVSEKNIGNNIVLLNYVSEDELPDYMALADAFISPLNDTVQDWARCPSKIYMYLPYQKPIITNPIGEPIQVFGDKGNYFKPGSSNDLTKLIKMIIDNNLWHQSIEFNKHTWEARTNDLSAWIKETILK